MTESRRIAFVSARFPREGAAGGAETLLLSHARRLARAGRDVVFLATCATDHVSWRNELPPGERVVDGLRVRLFPVDSGRDEAAFLRAQAAVSRGRLTADREETWLKHHVHSTALYEHLASQDGRYDRIVAGPYLFGLTCRVAAAFPERTVLVPCLHDEPFARLAAVARMFREVRTVMFNSEPERALAETLYGAGGQRRLVVGMGMDDFASDGAAFRRSHRLDAPYLLYAGRREPGKGTPMLLDYFAAFVARTGRDLDLALAGSGSMDVPAEIAPRVRDLGFLSEQGKRDAMAGALVFCHPSRNESLGIVLLEAWLARSAALVHAGSEVLRHHCRRSGGGLWFAGYPEFEEALIRLMDAPALQRGLGEAGRRYVLAQYGWSAIEPKLHAALDA
jgi:glycosyltransferase involved in cell wall biosynthesis